ncbi:MAG: cohesin domain-containing protein [bacterium]
MRRILVLMAAVLVAGGVAIPAFAAETGGQLDDCIHVHIGNVIANPGEDIQVPVTISNVTGWGVMAFDMEICWCELPAGLLQFTDCSPGEVVLSSGWMLGACGMCGPNCVTAVAAGATPLIGEGVLFYLNFHVSANAKPCMCCQLCFEEVNLYDPEEPLNVCAYCGEVCIDYCSVKGQITAWYCREGPCEDVHYMPQEGVRVHLSQCDEAIASTYTDSDGLFMFDCLDPLDGVQTLQPCPYCLELDDCAVPRALINAFDASLILRYLVCMDYLTCCAFDYCDDCDKPGMVYPQQVAADVNCTGMITAYDASLILQFVVGLIPAFPCPTNWVWYWMDCFDGCTYDCHTSVWAIGVPKGDVSGYCYAGGGKLALTTPTVKLGIPEHFDGYVEVPVMVKNAENIYSTQFEVEYNAGDFDVTQVTGVGLGSGMMTAYNADNGNLLIAMAGSSPFSGSGKVAKVTLQKKHTPIPVASTRMEITGALLNEAEPVIEGHQYDGEVVRFALGPVSPNPFRDAAVISYSAPQAASVTIDVYDVNGRLVQTVYNGQVEAGAHQVTWDGRDSAGDKVARGVYFCRMSAGEFSATEKMVLLQ